jgi:hypothetical protein
MTGRLLWKKNKKWFDKLFLGFSLAQLELVAGGGCIKNGGG